LPKITKRRSQKPLEASAIGHHWLLEEEAMPTIYISDRGDDKNDGLSLQTPVYSLKRAQKLQGGKNDYSWHFGPRAWERIKKELADKHEKK
jgi:hypothetical protein